MNGLHELRPHQVTALARTENWKPVVGYEGFYEVSDFGHVRSIDRTVEVSNRWGSTHERKFTGKILEASAQGRDYFYVSLSKPGGRQKKYSVHALVLGAFVGDVPDGRECAHWDGVRSNNALLNLRYATHVENCADKVAHGTNQAGEKNPYAKLTDSDVIKIKSLSGSVSQREIAEIFKVGQSTIWRVIHCKTWRHVDGV